MGFSSKPCLMKLEGTIRNRGTSWTSWNMLVYPLKRYELEPWKVEKGVSEHGNLQILSFILLIKKKWKEWGTGPSDKPILNMKQPSYGISTPMLGFLRLVDNFRILFHELTSSRLASWIEQWPKLLPANGACLFLLLCCGSYDADQDFSTCPTRSFFPLADGKISWLFRQIHGRNVIL